MDQIRSAIDSIARVSLPPSLIWIRRPECLSIQSVSRKHYAILDSSFNPPTLAHLSLLQRTIEYIHTNDSTKFIGQSVVDGILLLSVFNADKRIITGAPLYHRIGMLLSSEDLKPFAIAIVNRSLFVDKALLLANELDQDSRKYSFSSNRLSKILNFD